VEYIVLALPRSCSGAFRGIPHDWLHESFTALLARLDEQSGVCASLLLPSRIHKLPDFLFSHNAPLFFFLTHLSPSLSQLLHFPQLNINITL
jgi:hypothetical protein